MAIAEPLRLQRHTRRAPCPVCGGGDDDPRGRGVRCDGFTSADGRYAHCSREERAGALLAERNGRTYAHRLDGPCLCGGPHVNGTPSETAETRRAQPKAKATKLRACTYERIPDTITLGKLKYCQVSLYAYPHVAGQPHAHEVRRYDLPDGSDKTYRPYSQRADGLWVMSQDGAVPWPLYNLPALSVAPTDAPVIWVEGEKCAQAAQAALRAAGVPWVVTTTQGGSGQVASRPIAMFAPIAGRVVVTIADNDTSGEHYVTAIAEQVRKAGAARVAALQLEGLQPAGDVFDWLVAGHDGLELVKRVTAALQPATTGAQATQSQLSGDDDEMYRCTDGGLRRVKWEVGQGGQRKSEPALIPLTNFNARIVADTLEDDGAETRRAFDLEATLCIGDPARRAQRRFQLSAERFSTMSWPTEHLGAAAIVYPGQNTREHTRVAIQMLSGLVPERRVYTHTGWRKVDDEWVYLHAGGAIGASGVRADVSVALSGDLARYELPKFPEVGARSKSDIIEATRASLRMLDVAPINVTAPIFSATYRALLSNADFAVHIGGQTGEGKSELAALGQQHYGPTMDARHLPASWSSTGNALEAQAFQAKDALLVIDDFIPTGTTVDAQRLHGVAERVLRAQGNHSGRQRLRADTTPRPTKPPRGLILSTGEDIPRGTSLRARMVVLEHAPGTMDWQKLSACQRDASGGRYALAMAAYIRWVAARYDAIQAELRPQAIREMLASRQAGRAAHKRTSDNVAQLIAAVVIFTRYACEIGALTAAEAEELRARVERALIRVGEQQATLQAQGEPTTRFLTLLNTAITSGEAYLAGKQGEHPGDAQTPWGWRLQSRGAGENTTVEWVPIGRKVGWIDGDNLYILPDAAFAAAQRIGQPSGDALTVTAGTLWKRLKERGYLLSWDRGRETNKKRMKLEGRQQNVLHLHVSALASLSPDDNPTNPTSGPEGAPEGAGNAEVAASDYRVSVSDSVSDSAAETDTEATNPTYAMPDSAGADASRVGFVGFSEDESASRTGVRRTPEGYSPGGARYPSGYLAPEPDKPLRSGTRTELLTLACTLGWPELQVAHLRIYDERAWRSVASGSDADVNRALLALMRHAETSGGVNHASN